MQAAEKDRASVQKALGISSAALSQLINNSPSGTKEFKAENSARAAAFLRVNHHWLATGEGDMKPTDRPELAPFSPGALELAELYDMIPQQDRLRRSKAYASASRAILDVLESE